MMSWQSNSQELKKVDFLSPHDCKNCWVIPEYIRLFWREKNPRKKKKKSTDLFHSALFSYGHITLQITFKHHTWSTIFSSTSQRPDIHTNTPWVHHCSESASSMCVGPLTKSRSCEPTNRENLGLQWRLQVDVTFPTKPLQHQVCRAALIGFMWKTTCISLEFLDTERKSNR